jgi:uncharacterized protein YdeI (YjbR/CyaY-like superfamily)
MAELPELLLPDVAAWHDWLLANHADSPGVLLVLSKKGGRTTSLTYDQALEEALCFGWIDGQVSRRDDQTFRQRFTARRRRSPWSARNVGIATGLIEQGRMQPAGQAAVDAAKADGRWAAAYRQADATVPPDLAAAIAADPAAQATFETLSAQNRFALVFRLGNLRTEAARERKIGEYVAMLARGETLHPQRSRPATPG